MNYCQLTIVGHSSISSQLVNAVSLAQVIVLTNSGRNSNSARITVFVMIAPSCRAFIQQCNSRLFSAKVAKCAVLFLVPLIIVYTSQ